VAEVHILAGPAAFRDSIKIKDSKLLVRAQTAAGTSILLWRNSP
jgi:hypothetical protein